MIGLGAWDAAQIAQVIGAAGQDSSTAIMAANAPPGYVFNPAIGQYLPAVGYGTTSGVVPGTTVSANLTGSLMPLIIGFGALVVLLMVMKR